jgi:hypothetical protein
MKLSTSLGDYRALVTTETKLEYMAVAAIMGLRRLPRKGHGTSATALMIA